MNSMIVFVAKYFLYLSVAVVGLYWVTASRRDKVGLGLRLVIGGAIALVLARIGAHYFYDTRPFARTGVKPLIPHANDNGFPSDHALLASFLGFTMLVYSRAIGFVLLAIAALIGGARVSAHIHSPIDIVGSFAFAAAAALLADQGVKRFGTNRTPRTWRQRKL